MRLDTHRLQTLDQVREFLAGSEGIDLQPQSRADACAFVARTLQRFDYALRGKTDKGLLRRFLVKATGLSRAQITRLLRQHRTTGGITDRRGAPNRPFIEQHELVLLSRRKHIQIEWLPIGRGDDYAGLAHRDPLVQEPGIGYSLQGFDLRQHVVKNPQLLLCVLCVHRQDLPLGVIEVSYPGLFTEGAAPGETTGASAR